MKTFLSLLVCLGLGSSVSYGVTAAKSFKGNKLPEAGVQALESKVPSWLEGGMTYHGSGVLFEGESETSYELSIHFADDGMIETTIYSEEEEENFAYQWVFGDDDSGEFSVVVFDEEGNPETVGEGLCDEESCHMAITDGEEEYLEESFYFSDDLLYKEGYFADQDSEAVWEEELQSEEETPEEDEEKPEEEVSSLAMV